MPRLLLIEDDGEIAALLDRYLKRNGWQVTHVPDGDAGLAAFTQGAFDIVLTDGLLPKRTGYEVAQAIRAQPKGHDVGIIMMSAAFRGNAARADAISKGVDVFFAKPFVLGELKEKLATVMAKYGRDKPSAVAPPVTPLVAPPVTPPPVAAPPVRAPTPAAPNKPKDIERVAAKNDVASPEQVAHLLLRCARQRFTGVVRFIDESSQLQVGFVSGVVVGANDNLREHLLGERLWKQGRLSTDQMRQLNTRMADKGERVAEALLALGFCTADEAFNYVEEQVATRVQRALSWTGVALVKESEQDAHAVAVTSIEIADCLLAFASSASQEGAAARFVAANAGASLEIHPRFEEMLAAFARVQPTGKLPPFLLQRHMQRAAVTVDAAAAVAGGAELYGAHLVGAVRAPMDPAIDPRGLPEVLRSATGDKLVDKGAAARVCAVLLRGRGRNHYDLAGLAKDADSSELLTRLEGIERDVGRDALRGTSLGPATAAARELWQLLDEARMVFTDPVVRLAYDRTLVAPAPRAASVPSHEDAFLEGQQALSSDAADGLARALTCFARAAEGRPNDPDFASYLGWAEVLNEKRTDGVARLTATAQRHPQAMRPLFFLGLLAAREGDVARAKQLLDESHRRAPDDVEVSLALSALT